MLARSPAQYGFEIYAKSGVEWTDHKTPRIFIADTHERKQTARET